MGIYVMIEDMRKNIEECERIIKREQKQLKDTKKSVYLLKETESDIDYHQAIMSEVCESVNFICDNAKITYKSGKFARFEILREENQKIYN